MTNQSSSGYSLSSPAVSTRRKFPATKKFVATAAAAALLGGIGAIATVLPAQAAGATTASADSYTVSTLPTRNYGAVTKIAVGSDNSDLKNGYLKFTNLGAIAATDTLNLKLTVTGGTAGTIKASQLQSNNWAETSIAYANAPVGVKTVGTAKIGAGAQSVTLSLTGLTSTDGTVSIGLAREAGGISRIASREAAAAQRPTIEVTASTTPPVVPPVVPPVEPPVVPPTTPGTNCTVSVTLVPSCGTWFGAAGNPEGGESWDAAQTRFEKDSGRTMDITHYYKRGQSAMFPTANELSRQNETNKNRILLYNWKPSGLTWRQVANGAADPYLKSLGAYMKANASKKFFLSLNAEMEDEVNQTPGSGQTATDFRDFFRHTTQVLRASGGTNAITVMNYTGIEKWGTMSWFNDLYPGDDVVDWIAQDPYAFGKPPVWLTDFSGMVNRTSNPKVWPGFYNWAATNHPSKPQMLGEWGVDEDTTYPDYKRDFFNTAASQLKQFPKLKALVYWDSTGYTPDGTKLPVGITNIDSKASSLAAFRSYISTDVMNQARNSYFK